MPWTLQHGETTQSLEAWGISNAVVSLKSFAPSTLTFTVSGNFDTTPLFANAAQVTLRDPDNVVRYIGKRRKAPQRVAGHAESRSYYFEDVLGDLNRRAYLTAWNMWTGEALETVSSPVGVLFGTSTGIGVSAQLSAIISGAAAAGISVQIGTSGSITAVPQRVDVRGRTFLEVLKIATKLAPDLATWVDYTTTPVTLNFVRRSAATEHSLAVIETADSFELEPLHDQQVSAVVLKYEKTATVGQDTYNSSYQDVAPEGATGTEENAFVAHVPLKASRMGRSTTPPPPLLQSQTIVTQAISATSFAWWEELWPALAGRNEAATLTSGSVSGTSGMRQIISGAQPEWAGSAETVLVEATFNGVIAGQEYVGKVLQARVNASSLTTGTYTRVGTSGLVGVEGEADEPGEVVPTGIAALMYSALNPLQWAGHHERTAAEPSWTIKPGSAVNFTGTAESAHASARAWVQTVELDIDAAKTRLEFGQSNVLPFDDLVELYRSVREIPEGTRAAEVSGTGVASAHTVSGSGMGAGYSFSIPTPTNTETHPFKVTWLGGDSYRVAAGQFQGYYIAAETMNVGGSRPVCIRINAKFNVSISNGDWAYGATLDETPAPDLEYSSYITGDLTELDTSGNGARCMLAVLNSGGVVAQLATANITCVINDSGAGDGTSVITFDKD